VTGPGTARALALALAGLRGLSGWEPVDALVERVVEALRGGDGLAPADAARLHRWSSTWARTRPEVRRFYRAALDAEATGIVAAGLWSLLDGRPADRSLRPRLARLHLDLLGEEAGIDLTARPRAT